MPPVQQRARQQGKSSCGISSSTGSRGGWRSTLDSALHASRKGLYSLRPLPPISAHTAAWRAASACLSQCMCAPAARFRWVVHLIEAGCFPTTPEAPGVWFDDILMRLSYQVRVNGAVALSKWAKTLFELHSTCGCSTAASSFKHLGEALVQYEEVQAATMADAKACLQPITEVRNLDTCAPSPC